MKNEVPFYEMLSGAALAFAAVLLIFPGFLTDFFGLILIFPPSRKLLFTSISKKYKENPKNKNERKNFIEGEFEDIDEDQK